MKIIKKKLKLETEIKQKKSEQKKKFRNFVN